MTTTTVPSVAERVQAGAAWLDEHEPGWVDRVDLDRLNLENCHACMLGQLFGYYVDAIKDHLGDDDEVARRFGFEIPAGVLDRMDASRRYAELTAAWRDLIVARRAGGSR